MIAIVMTYYNRQTQLNRTLESFSQYDPDEFRVVIVDDGSPEDIRLPETKFEVVVLKMYNKTWVQCDPTYNIGFHYALLKRPDIIIIQNAECYHLGDVLSYAKRVDDKSYISFGCYSQGRGEVIGSVINNRCATHGGDSAWYNHPIYRPVGYHFCSAITAENLLKLNGFDERFAFGIGYDDDYFLHQIRCLGLKVEITSDPIVIHQWHEQMMGNDYEGNGKIYQELIKENNYRAKHLVTQDI
jgi:glycosyltransferase involved in cell wall biosynthesis